VENITDIQEPDEDGILQMSYEADHYQISTGYREGILESALTEDIMISMLEG